MSVTAYEILRARTSDNLQDLVTTAISNSWQPLGSPFVTEEHFVCQAMITGSQVLVGATGAQGATGPQGATGASAAVQTFYGTTSSAANTYTATITGATPLAVGSIFAIKFTHAPTGAATMNINSVGAKPIVTPVGGAIAGTQGVDGQIAVMVYDGTSFIYVVQPNNA